MLNSSCVEGRGRSIRDFPIFWRPRMTLDGAAAVTRGRCGRRRRRSAQEFGYRGGQVGRRRGGEVLVAAAGEPRDSLPGCPVGVGPEVDDVDRDRLGRVGALLDELLQAPAAKTLI